MKKARTASVVALIALIGVFVLIFAACAPKPEPDPGPATYTATFETNGGSAVAPMEGITSIDTAPTTTREGYNFAGWYTDAAFTAEAIFPYTLTADVKFYAKWSADQRPEDPDPEIVPSLSENMAAVSEKLGALYALEENKAFKVDAHLSASYTPEGGEAQEVTLTAKGNVDYRNDDNSVFYLELKKAEDVLFGLYYEQGETYLQLYGGGGNPIF